MVRRGWTQIIRGRRPPSVKWPVSEKKGGATSAASTSHKKSPSQSKPAPKGQSKVDRLQAALQALGPEESVAKTALVEAINSAKAEVPAGAGTRGIRCQNSSGGGDQFSEGRVSEAGPPSTDSCRARVGRVEV